MNEKDQPAKSDSRAVTDLSGNLPQQEHPRIFSRWVIPWDVAGRIGLLFVALCSIKLAMLIGFQVHLFEIHWRLDEGKPPRGLNPAAFFIFSIFVAVSLWRLGE